MLLSRLPRQVFPLLLSASILAGSAATTWAVTPASRSGQNKLSACQNRQSKITGRMSHTISQLDKHFKVFGKLQTRVETRLTRVQSSGKVVPNASALSSALVSAKAAAQAAIAKAKSDTFSCTDANPKGELATFREDVKAAKGALHDYRVAIKNLNMAISSVAGPTSRSGAGSAGGKAGQ